MNERMPGSKEDKLLFLKTEIITATNEVLGRTFEFSGIAEDKLSKLREDEKDLPEGYFVPIDKILERLRAEGVKFVFGKNPESGTIFVIPAGSDPITAIDNFEFVFPSVLETNNLPDEAKRVIELDKEIRNK